MEKSFKKDYASRRNKEMETRSVTAKEVFEMIGLMTIITLGIYIVLGFLGLL